MIPLQRPKQLTGARRGPLTPKSWSLAGALLQCQAVIRWNAQPIKSSLPAVLCCEWHGATLSAEYVQKGVPLGAAGWFANPIVESV